MKSLLLWLCLLAILPSFAQSTWRRAFATERAGVHSEPVPVPADVIGYRNEGPDQMEGFPKVAPANKVFKNFRNVTLADLDGRPGAEILWTAGNRLMASSSDSLLWEKVLVGLGIYPPSVADLNGDGRPEIVQVTGGNATGRVYVLDEQGNDLPGWPRNFEDNWMSSAPTLVNIDGAGTVEILVSELLPDNGRIHILRLDGESFSSDWPVTLDARPAVTPSVGDLNNDGTLEIVVFSTESRYVLGLDGQPLPGWPQTTHPQQRYSFQSPVLADLDKDGTLEIIGATHGLGENAAPQFFIQRVDGSFPSGWPITIPDSVQTFNTPTVVDWQGAPAIFMSRPISEGQVKGVVYGWDAQGNLLPGFPIVKSGGLEGIISVANVDPDADYELIFGSNMIDPEGFGFIHAYDFAGGQVAELNGYPLRPRGFTFMNGAALGDVNGDARLDLVALSYVQRFGLGPDSVYLNVYELEVPYQAETVKWGTYKGDNTRRGVLNAEVVTSGKQPANVSAPVLRLIPNPASDRVQLTVFTERPLPLTLELIDSRGRVWREIFRGQLPQGEQQWMLPLNNLPAGAYWISVRGSQNNSRSVPLIKK